MRITYINSFDFKASTKDFPDTKTGWNKADGAWSLLEKDRSLLFRGMG